MIRWAILTGEYPPDSGGVSDYTRLVAQGLAETGDSVQVFASPLRDRKVVCDDPGVIVHRLPGRFGPRSLQVLEMLLAKRPRPDRVLVQYVPHAFGFKAMNLPFALWVASRLRKVAPVWTMFHEVAYPLRWKPIKHLPLGISTRVMARLVAGAASRVLVSIPAWGAILQRINPRARVAEWLPVPCTLPTDPESGLVAALRGRYIPTGSSLVGHFGTFGRLITDLLTPSLCELLRLTSTSILLIGRGSASFRERFVVRNSAYNTRVFATEELPRESISAHLHACDLLLQPFPDGISSRRTSAMAALANGIPLVTNLGALSEEFWSRGAVASVPAPDAMALANLAAVLLSDSVARADFGRRGFDLYRDTFALEHTIAQLRGNP